MDDWDDDVIDRLKPAGVGILLLLIGGVILGVNWLAPRSPSQTASLVGNVAVTVAVIAVVWKVLELAGDSFD